MRRGGEIKLTTPIPVHITYFTAVVDDDGKLHYRPDVYGMDGRIATALEGRSVNLAVRCQDAHEPREKPRPRAKAERKSREAAKPGDGESRDLGAQG